PPRRPSSTARSFSSAALPMGRRRRPGRRRAAGKSSLFSSFANFFGGYFLPSLGAHNPRTRTTTKQLTPLVTLPDVDLAGAVLAIKPGNGDKDRNVHSRNDWRRWPRRRGCH